MSGSCKNAEFLQLPFNFVDSTKSLKISSEQSMRDCSILFKGCLKRGKLIALGPCIVDKFRHAVTVVA